MPRVYLHFEGIVTVEIDGDPEADAWEDAVSEAWGDITIDEVSEAASLTGHDIAEEGEPTAAYRN